MLVVGLTGGIACGKSTVSTRLKEQYKLPIVDADQIAREIVAPGQDAYKKIVNHFQQKIPDLLQSDGKLNRQALGKWVFSNRDDLKVLNSITHPAIRYEIFRQILKYYLKGYKMCVLDIPLLFESKLDTFCGITISVICNEETQLQRLRKRNPELSIEDARNRIASQMPMSDRIKLSDFVIENNDSIATLNAQLQGIISQINPGFLRTTLEYFPPFGTVSALAIVVAKYLRKRAVDKQ